MSSTNTVRMKVRPQEIKRNDDGRISDRSKKEEEVGRSAGRRRRREEAERDIEREFNKVVILVLLM